MQKVLIIETMTDNLRSKINRWDTEGCHWQNYNIPLEALADGWKLLAPPMIMSQYLCQYKWWLVKD